MFRSNKLVERIDQFEELCLNRGSLSADELVGLPKILRQMATALAILEPVINFSIENQYTE